MSDNSELEFFRKKEKLDRFRDFTQSNYEESVKEAIKSRDRLVAHILFPIMAVLSFLFFFAPSHFKNNSNQQTKIKNVDSVSKNYKDRTDKFNYQQDKKQEDLNSKVKSTSTPG